VPADHLKRLFAHAVNAGEQLHAPAAVLDVGEKHLALEVLAHNAPADGDGQRRGRVGIGRFRCLEGADGLARRVRAADAVGVGLHAALL